jgi:hypothetical protein
MSYKIRFESYGISGELRGQRWEMTEAYPSQADAHHKVFVGARRNSSAGASEITRIVSEHNL